MKVEDKIFFIYKEVENFIKYTCYEQFNIIHNNDYLTIEELIECCLLNYTLIIKGINGEDEMQYKIDLQKIQDLSMTSGKIELLSQDKKIIIKSVDDYKKV